MSGSGRTMLASKACDGCRLRKVKCDMTTTAMPTDSAAPYQLRDQLTSPRCQRCIRLDLSCTFDKPSKHRGPRKRSRDKTDEQDMTATAITALSPGCLSGPSISSRIDSFFIEPTPFTPEPDSSYFRSRSTTSYPTDGLCARPLLQLIVDDYLRLLYPLIPVVHRPSFRRDFMNNHDVDDKVFLGLLLAICSITIGLLPSRFDVYCTWSSGPPLRFKLREEMMNYCYEYVIRLRGPRYFDEINFQKLAISYLMSIAFFQLGDQNTARMMEVEAMQLGRLLQVHKISEYADLNCIEAQLRKKGFWLLFYAYVHSELQNLRKERLSFLDPILLSSINLEQLLPLDIDDEQILEDTVLPSEHPGEPCLTTAFIIHSRVFWAALRSTDLSKTTPTTEDAQESPCICKRWRNLAANVTHLRGRLQELKYMLDVLPEQLLPWAPGSGHNAAMPPSAVTLLPLNNDSTDIVDRQFAALRANLHVTHLWLQSIIIDQLDSAEVQSNSLDGHSIKLEYWTQREDISRQLLHLLHTIPEADLEPNGLHLAFKVRDIAVGLLECPYDKTHSAAKRAAEYIQQLTLILARLDRSEQANIVNLQSWIDTDRIGQNRTAVSSTAAARTGYGGHGLGLPMTPRID